MAIYDGVVTVADDDIPVIVELDDDRIRLSASGTEIGEWATGDCSIIHVADATYSISAEEETLHFVPNQPSLFAAAVDGNGHKQPKTPAAASMDLPAVDAPQPEIVETSSDGVREAPPPKPLTVGLFYGLCAITAALGIWAIVSMVF